MVLNEKFISCTYSLICLEIFLVLSRNYSCICFGVILAFGLKLVWDLQLYHAALILGYATLCLIFVVHNLSVHFFFKINEKNVEKGPYTHTHISATKANDYVFVKI